MKYIFLILLNLWNISCYAQNRGVYNIFDRELKNVLMTFEIDDKNNINVKIANKESRKSIIFSESLSKTNDKNIFVLKTDLFKDNKRKGFALLEFVENGKMITMYDTIFQNKIQIEKFISKALNLKESMAIYLIKDLSLEKIKNFPSIIKINKEKLELLKLKIKDRNKYLDDISKNTDIQKQINIFMKGKMWLNMQCLLLGYKFPLDDYENEFILNKIKQ